MVIVGRPSIESRTLVLGRVTPATVAANSLLQIRAKLRQRHAG